MGKKIGFISTRFAGADGVTLEALKWADVFRRGERECFWFGGRLDRDVKRSYLSSEASAEHPDNQWINRHIFRKKSREPSVTKKIHEVRDALKLQLHEFIERFDLDVLIIENALALPIHVPLGLALAELLAETKIPAVAHHHEFYWERSQFVVNAIGDYLQMAFPPNLPNIQHIVLNTSAQEALAHRTGISALVIPNVLDFDTPPQERADAAERFKIRIPLQPDESLILQPTRIVRRKGIEYAVELVRRLRERRCKLLISHEVEEEDDYVRWLKHYAADHGVDLKLVSVTHHYPWELSSESDNRLTLWDLYPHADFVTYPSLYEGFGNVFLEAIYFRKPLLINRYATFVRDIEPKGFDLTIMEGYLNAEVVDQVRQILNSETRRAEMVEKNYRIAARYFSYRVLEKRLNFVLMILLGVQL